MRLKLDLLAIHTIEAAYRLEDSQELIRNFIITIEHIRSESLTFIGEHR